MTKITRLSIMKVTRTTLVGIALLYQYRTHIRTNFHDRIVDRTSLFISLINFKIINSKSHNVFLHY